MRSVFALLAALLLLPACGTPDDAAAPATAQTDYRVEDFQYALLPGGARVLTGTFYNPTDEALRNAQIQVSLFDRDNQKVSALTILVRDVPAGGRKAFREPVDSDVDVRGARVRSVMVL